MTTKRRYQKMAGMLALSLFIASAFAFTAAASGTKDIDGWLDDQSKWVKWASWGDTNPGSDEFNWTAKGLKQGNPTGYTVSAYDEVSDGLLRANIQVSGHGYAYLGIRVGSPTGLIIGNGPTAEARVQYGLFITPAGIDVAKRDVNDAAPGTIIHNVEAANILRDGANHEVEYGAVNTDNGIQIVMKVDGKAIVDYEDTEVGADSKLRQAGYFTFATHEGVEMMVERIGAGGSAAGGEAGAASNSDDKATAGGTAPTSASEATGGSQAAANPKTGDSGMAFYSVLAMMMAAVALFIGGIQKR